MRNGGKNKIVVFIILFSVVISTPETFNARSPSPDGSYRKYQGETSHVPGRLLNGDAEVNYLED